ncbi:MAG: leucine-rich repeat domain-containing protein [Propionibacteriaceae bacterium]|nr:leucine-rich repeat domain-containing protein [Propionibacteriaceae bacterium]
MKSLPRILSLILGASLAMSAVIATSAQSVAAESVIKDPTLISCITSTMSAYFLIDPISEGVITAEDLDNYSAASAAQGKPYSLACSGVATLEGLQYFNDPYLNNVSIWDSTFEDLTPLAALTGLVSLALENGQIHDLTPLAGLTKLTYLDLSGNRIETLTGLEGLINLTTLDVADNSITDLTPLSGLTDIVVLQIFRNTIQSLAGLEAMSDLERLDAFDNRINDITALTRLTKINTLYLSRNQISDVTALAGMNKLLYLELDDNQIVDISPLAYLSRVIELVLTKNQIVDISPLAWLTTLSSVWLDDNKITYIYPMAEFINGTVNFDPQQGAITTRFWTFDGNQITDLSVLDWNKIAPLRIYKPSTSYKVVFGYTVNGQTVKAPAKAELGSTIPLPSVLTPRGTTYPISWSVTGNATIDETAGTLTLTGVGPVTLRWADEGVEVQCRSDYVSEFCLPGAATGILSFFSGTMDFTVVEPGPPEPEPSVNNSDAEKDQTVSAATGGQARLADGQDSYSLTVTLRDPGDNPMPGFAGELSVDGPDGCEVTNIVDHGDGTYSITVASSNPSSDFLSVLLGGERIGNPIPVNFIGAQVSDETVAPGGSQDAEGMGFLPGEQVSITMNSTPVDFGTHTANQQGNVAIAFPIPKDFELGRHTVTFMGEISGKVTVGFDVRMTPCCGPPPQPLGGISLPGGGLPWLVFLMIAGAAVFSARMVRRDS